MRALNSHRYNCGDLKAICACLHPKLLSCASRGLGASRLNPPSRHSLQFRGASWRQRSRLHAAVTCRAPVPDNTTFLQPKPCTDAPTGVGSDDGTRRPRAVFGGNYWADYISVAKYILGPGGMGLFAFAVHPKLVILAADVFHLDWNVDASGFQSSFFSILSLLFAIFSGNSMGFLYDRQRQLVTRFYDEVNLLEEVIEESVYSLGRYGESYSILTQCRKYIDQEIRAINNQLPPLEDGLALSVIRMEARRFKSQLGADVSGIMAATSKLSEAQNMWQASSLRALPFVHWVLLYIIAITFCLTLVILEPGKSFSSEGRHLLFTVLCTLMTFVLLVIGDLARPQDGVYSSSDVMEERLRYTHRMIDRHQLLPVIPEPGVSFANANNNAYMGRRPVGVSVTDDDVDGTSSSSTLEKGLASLQIRQQNMPRPPIPALRQGKGREKEGGRGVRTADLYGMQPPERRFESLRED